MTTLDKLLKVGAAAGLCVGLTGCGIDHVGFCEAVTEQLIYTEDRFEVIEITDASKSDPPTVYVRYETMNDAAFKKTGMVTCTFDNEEKQATRVVVDGVPMDDATLRNLNQSFL